MRETVALAWEAFGGNGILLEFDVARYLSDPNPLAPGDTGSLLDRIRALS
jgi:alkylation response protein AidB-like acyl-CoA dehydrogenase